MEVDSSKTNTYTGSPVIPEVIVKDASGNIINSSYYKVVAVNNIAVNTATTGETQDVGKGNIYTDLPYYIVIGDGIHTSATLYGNFTIVADTIANASISAIPALEYTGTVVTPNITVTYAGKELTVDTDYTVSIYEAKDISMANVTITGTNTYNGLTAREEGTAYGLKYYNTVMENGVPTKQGGEYVKGDELSEVVKPSFTVKTATGEDITLSENDYTLKVYSDAECSKEVREVKEIGTYYAKLMGNGNFLPSSYKVVKFEVKEKVEKTVEEIQEELDAAKEELNTAKEELETAKKELQEAIDSNNVSQAKIDELTKEVADQQAAVDDLKKQIEELQNQKAVDQKITVTKKAKTFQAKNLKSKKGTFQIKAAAQTDLSYKTMKTDAKKKVTVKASGKVVVKKGTKAGTYKVKVRAVAAKTDVFNKAIKNFMVTVTVK